MLPKGGWKCKGIKEDSHRSLNRRVVECRVVESMNRLKVKGKR
jgi:hypothetical protein